MLDWFKGLFVRYRVVEVQESDRTPMEQPPRDSLVGLRHNLGFQWLLRSIRLQKAYQNSLLLNAKSGDREMFIQRIWAIDWLEKMFAQNAQMSMRVVPAKEFETRMFDEARKNIVEIEPAKQ